MGTRATFVDPTYAVYDPRNALYDAYKTLKSDHVFIITEEFYNELIRSYRPNDDEGGKDRGVQENWEPRQRTEVSHVAGGDVRKDGVGMSSLRGAMGEMLGTLDVMEKVALPIFCTLLQDNTVFHLWEKPGENEAKTAFELAKTFLAVSAERTAPNSPKDKE